MCVRECVFSFFRSFVRSLAHSLFLMPILCGHLVHSECLGTTWRYRNARRGDIVQDFISFYVLYVLCSTSSYTTSGVPAGTDNVNTEQCVGKWKQFYNHYFRMLCSRLRPKFNVESILWKKEFANRAHTIRLVLDYGATTEKVEKNREWIFFFPRIGLLARARTKFWCRSHTIDDSTSLLFWCVR